MPLNECEKLRGELDKLRDHLELVILILGENHVGHHPQVIERFRKLANDVGNYGLKWLISDGQ